MACRLFGSKPLSTRVMIKIQFMHFKIAKKNFLKSWSHGNSVLVLQPLWNLVGVWATVATQDWLLSHDRSSAGRRLAAVHWTTCQRPTTNRWPVIVQHKLSTEDRPLWPIRFDFGPKSDCRQKCFWNRTFRNLNCVMCKTWFCDYRWLLLYKDFSKWKSIMC